ncbi:hypothetical protein GE061_015350 [Apolygus lucorum]|uniref:Putative treble-clef zinc-finger domain-containing protein n=1 Tax=Apolygus lucorum TaxID=248454 RepID=A0A8S9XKQ4_APOLU|nr:hypothetical protein GE061_015350 [Apolygus lucorum]
MYFETDDTDSEKKAKDLLADLGKSTMRGIRKCPKCGTYNGTRGLSCKNKACDVVFKEAGEKKKQSVEVSKLNTGTSTRVYSVRMKDKGPDHRGFVQLPILQPDLTSDSDAYLSQVSALCFVESCQRLFNTNILKCHERQVLPAVSTCSHILSAMRCYVEASPLMIDYDILQSLNFCSSLKEEIWRMVSESPGPLVQRVSKNVMAVRCKVTTKDPLGFLHVSFVVSPRLKENVSICTCATPFLLTSKRPEKKSGVCMHYYVCIAAFASDGKCSEEFATFIVNETSSASALIAVQNGIMSDLDVEEPLVAIMSNDTVQDAVEVEVLHKDLMLTDIDQDFEGLTPVVELSEDLNDETLDLMIRSPLLPKKAKMLSSSPKRPRILPAKKPTFPNIRKKLLNKGMRVQLGFSDGAVDETKANLSFIEWLASVTERINQSMHYGFSGKPEPLVFHAPHAFFECLLERLMKFSGGNKRKRLPNLVTTFTRKDAPPLGMFNNYTWHITNIIHAKVIFDTPLIQLNVSRSFMLKSNGKYEEFDPGDESLAAPRKPGQAPLKPTEYKTYLKIGNTSPDQTSPYVLSIDWTPNVLPLSKVGELKIAFEYGHTQAAQPVLLNTR